MLRVSNQLRKVTTVQQHAAAFLLQYYDFKCRGKFGWQEAKYLNGFGIVDGRQIPRHQQLSTTCTAGSSGTTNNYPGTLSELTFVEREVPIATTSTTSSSRGTHPPYCRHKQAPTATTTASRDVTTAPTSRPLQGDDPNFLDDASPPQNPEERLEVLLRSSPGRAVVQDFLQVLETISNCKEGNSARRAELWMSRLHAEFQREGADDSSARPPVVSMEPHKSSECSLSVESLLTCHLYTIRAWGNSHGEDAMIAVKRAEKWLDESKKIASGAPAKEIRPFLTQCYNAYLDVCSKGRHSKVDKNAVRVNAKRAEDTLGSMVDQYETLGEDYSPVKPDTDSVNFVMRAITRCRKDIDIAGRTRFYLQKMEDSVEGRNFTPSSLAIAPSAKSYNLYLDALKTVVGIKARRSQRKGGKKSRSRMIGDRDDNDQGITDDDVIDEMKALHEKVDYMRDLFFKGRLGVIEDNIAYNTVLAAWAGISGLQRRHQAPMKAERIFYSMVDLSEKHNIREVAPDATSYFQVIKAWAQSGSEHAGEKASWWLDKHWIDFQKQETSAMVPTLQMYHAAMKAWSSVGNPERAEQVLVQMLERSKALKATQLEPNTEIFASIIQVWLAASESGKGGQSQQVSYWNRAVEWLEYVVEHDSECGPSSRHDIFLHILKVARLFARKRPDVLVTAERTFNNLRSSRHRVDQLAYTSMLSVGLMALSSPDDGEARTQFVSKLVNECCNDGLVSKPFVRALTNGIIFNKGWTACESSRLSYELFPHWPLPPSWTRNVQHGALLPEVGDFQRTNFKIDNDHKNF